MYLAGWAMATALLLLFVTKVLTAGDLPELPSSLNLRYTFNIHHSSPHATSYPPANLTIFHHTSTSPTLIKRAPSRRLSTCPTPTPSLAPSTFLHSRCRRTVSAVAYTITCSEVRDVHYHSRHHYTETVNHEGQCQEHEICVDGYGSDVEEGGAERGEEGVSVAYCVSMNNFVEIARKRVGHFDESVENLETVVVEGERGADGGNGRESAKGVEIVLTKPDHRSTLFARRMRLQAQTFGDMYGTKVWRTVKDGKAECKVCSSLVLRPLPVEARRVHVDVMLSGMELDTGGLMYLLGLHDAGREMADSTLRNL